MHPEHTTSLRWRIRRVAPGRWETGFRITAAGWGQVWIPVRTHRSGANAIAAFAEYA